MISNGLEIGTRALIAHKYAMDVIGNNIANVNTPGYSRERVVLQTTEPTQIPVISKHKPLASLGSGVKVAQIVRIRDEFLDTQQRDLARTSGQWSQTYQSLSIVENTLNEPSTSGLSASLNNYWNAWQSVASPDPSSTGARASLISQGQLLADQLRTTRQSLTDLQDNHDKDVAAKVTTINDLANQIATLNGQIVKSKSSGDANNLMDTRTQLVGQLAGLVNIEYYQDPTGSTTIAIGGGFLVSNIDASQLKAESDPSNKGFNTVTWADSGKPVLVNDGELYGLLKSRDVNVASFISGLDSMAVALVNDVNAVHRTGFGLNGETGMNFFLGTSAADVTINSELIYDPSQIGVSSQNVNMSGNGETASAIAMLRTKGTLNSGATSIDDYYQNMVTRIGTLTAEANAKVDTQTALKAQLDKQINSVSGVSIDEEMSDMIKFEHAYGASAKYIASVQRTLDELMAMLR